MLRGRAARSNRERCIKVLLFAVPLAWFLFAVKMAYLDADLDSGKRPTGLPTENRQGWRLQPGERYLHDEGGREKLGGSTVGNAERENSASKKSKSLRLWMRGETEDQLTVDMDYPGVGRRFDPPKQGEDGTAVLMDVDALDPEQRARYEEGLQQHNFNEYASELVSLQRTVPDYRDPGCASQVWYSRGVPMRPASIIICFYNEARSTLLRTVHSVLDKTPPRLLQEVILVDDSSHLEHLKDELDMYMDSLPKVKIIRMPERVGLVRARIAGIEVAKGPILIFLDSHIECGDGWIEPLVYEVTRDRAAAVTPIIDVIDYTTMQILKATDNIGVVDLKTMTFVWKPLTQRIEEMRKSTAHPFISPTMAGGLFAINKEFFLEQGAWDPGLVLWGGENLELSFKLWMCGGAILIHPCSRVSHVFRQHSPYLKENADRVVNGNAARVAEVWLDEYKDFFFKGTPYNATLYGDVNERKALRQKLGCRSFDWYVNNIYPELFVEGVGKRVGHIRSSNGLCLGIDGESGNTLILKEDCENAVVWQTTNQDEIRTDDWCLQFSEHSIHLSPCDSQGHSQAFTVKAQIEDNATEVTIIHIPTDLCLTISPHPGHAGAVSMDLCRSGDRQQIWNFALNPAALS